MTKEQFASQLNGNNYRSEITKAQIKEAAENNLVVMFGYSDDNVELRGAIYDEVGGHEECEVLLANRKVLQVEEPFEELDEQIAFLKKHGLKLNAKKVKAEYYAEGRPGWQFKTDIPHATFDIMEDNELAGKGIVFDVAAVS